MAVRGVAETPGLKGAVAADNMTALAAPDSAVGHKQPLAKCSRHACNEAHCCYSVRLLGTYADPIAASWLSGINGE